MKDIDYKMFKLPRRKSATIRFFNAGNMDFIHYEVKDSSNQKICDREFDLPCPICDAITEEERRIEFLEAMKGFWVD